MDNRISSNLVIPNYNAIAPIAIDTIANLIANYDSTYNGKYAIATDLGNELMMRSSNGWRSLRSTTSIALSNIGLLIIGGNGATYSQTDNTITVTWATHTLTSDINGSDCYLTAGTGSLISGVYTNFTYVDANTFTVTSSTSQTISGNLGSNTSETFITISGSSNKLSAISSNILPGDQISLFGIRKGKNSANTKTIKTYMYNAITTSIAPTTNTTFISFGTTCIFTSSTKFYENNTSTALATISDYSIAMSGQLASANDWVWLCPVRISSSWLGGA